MASTVTAPTADTLAALVLQAFERDGVAARFQRDGAWHEWQFADLGERARAIARGLVSLGIQPGDRVALLAETRPEWTLVDCAILVAAGVVVPVYATSSPQECQHVIAHSGARAVVCEDAAQLAKVEAVRAECRELEHLLTIEPAPGARSLDELSALGDAVVDAQLDHRLATVGPGDPATIVYTSGTTGPPKGCVLTHRNWVATVERYRSELDVDRELSVFLFLPLAHALARVTQLVTLHAGGTLAFWTGDTKKVVDDLAATRPTHLPSVPRVFEKVRVRALAAAGESGGPRRRLFDASLAVGRRYRRAQRRGSVRPALRLMHAAADRLVLHKVRDLFGGRLKLALSGAAPISPDVLLFFDACGVLILEGYGLTETCAAATLNTPVAFRFGTVGRPLPGTDVAIADDGEVLLRGPNVFAGYHRNEEATREAFTSDGWFRTGDLGSIDADGFLRIVGRKKDLIITSSGKNITPANLETALTESRWISHAVVFGDDRPYLVALLSLDPDEAPALADDLGIQPFPGVAALADDERVRARLASDVDAVNERFARIEQIKRFGVLHHDLTEAAGELTPTAKVKRAIAHERYRDRFDALYDEPLKRR